MTSLTRFFTPALVATALVIGAGGCSKPTETVSDKSVVVGDLAAVPPAETVAVPQQTFADPTAAMDALVAAIRANDRAALTSMLGIGYEDLVPEGDLDRADVEQFLAAYDAKHHIITDTPGKAVLAVGPEDWTLPIPVAQDGTAWHFDLAAAADEIAIRRIGRNELDVIQTALAYYDAQKEYASKDRNGDGILEYAQKVISTDGQKDGLYWPGEEGVSPLGPLLAEGVVPGEPYHGYRYRILTAQGAHAKGGAMNYVLGKRMSGGFALIAWPAAYGDTGIMTFVVNHDGVVYEKDLGDDTESAAAAITSFDPDDSWKAAEPAA